MKIPHAAQSAPHNLVSSGAQPSNEVLIVLATEVQKLLDNGKKKKIAVSPFEPLTTWNEPQLRKTVTKDIRSPGKQLQTVIYLKQLDLI